MNPVSGVVLFLIAHTVAAICGMPGTFLVVIGGIVFGLVWGTVWSVVGATLGAIAAFCVARYCLRQWVAQRFSQHIALKTINRLVQQNEWSCVLAIRFAPISPFSVVNFLFGLTGVPLKTYTLGTLVGIIPGTLAYTWLGVAGQDAWTGNGMTSLLIALVALAGLSAMPLLMKRRSPLR
ncbi:MAG: TVP38/TMEM64 family protein [Merismopedia sp. SIO2A8]|nr:TVP38/TMEM64 family protein [Merismopedia sp. SIO2A8]